MPESVTDGRRKPRISIPAGEEQAHITMTPRRSRRLRRYGLDRRLLSRRTGPVSEHVLPGQTAAQHRSKRNGHNAFRGQGSERERLNGAGATGEDGIPAKRELVRHGNCRSVWNHRNLTHTQKRTLPRSQPEIPSPCDPGRHESNGDAARLAERRGSGWRSIASHHRPMCEILTNSQKPAIRGWMLVTDGVVRHGARPQ